MSTGTMPRSGSGDVSKSLELLWNPPGPGARGPRRDLSLGQIVNAAVALADREGLGALSMRRVAGELGVGTMSLYRYVPGKGELLDLMLDKVGGFDGDPSAYGGRTWREVIELFARGLWDLYWKHPWLVGVNQTRPLLGPSALSGLDFLLGQLADLAVTDKQKMMMIMAIEHYVTGSVRTFLLQKLAEQESGMTDEEFWAAQYPVLAAALDSGDFPHMATLDDDTFAIGAEEAFEFGLVPLLDGLEAVLSGAGR